MALDGFSGYVAPNNLTESMEPPLSMFDVQRVQLKFPIAADFVAAQVANNVLMLALSTGRILRIDLDTPEDIDGMLPVLKRFFPAMGLNLPAHAQRCSFWGQISTFQKSRQK